ncbi:glycosyltransferase family 2 protein [Roseateles asaccharophilus]|uniref:Glycosyltransferase involved in cell wall biosynthesis n=1 Tax=Roseateles asaccharophilus TaxID=582607 RepID=A0ABU2ADP4_9BURK|nr:glycosyltransferase family 2 protein [Roseateles asaccharophilus]MDR7334723.1 glycosyltransferase involved in cell wall biosynthesis [Roseateles asaccharophilus]
MTVLPKVSIVTPAYNQGEYLAAAMRSVLTQDYANLEYLVIDDGSSDDSLAVAQAVAAEFPDRVKVQTQANAGQAETLNRGWAVCQGEILGYLSSDDVLLPGAVSRLVASLQRRPDVSLVYADFWLIDPAGNRLRQVQAPEFDRRAMLENLVCAPGVGALFRREVFDATGGWDPRRRQVPDFEFWLRVAERGDFLRVPFCLSEYRIHEGSASYRVMPVARAEEIVAVIQGHWAARPETPPALARRSVARAHGLSGKNHAQSGRPWQSLRHYLQAFSLRPGLLLELGMWRQIAVGFLRRAYFGRRVKE